MKETQSSFLAVVVMFLREFMQTNWQFSWFGSQYHSLNKIIKNEGARTADEKDGGEGGGRH